jgi:hypothetical protein
MLSVCTYVNVFMLFISVDFEEICDKQPLLVPENDVDSCMLSNINTQ